jgi:hypothetical protein
MLRKPGRWILLMLMGAGLVLPLLAQQRPLPVFEPIASPAGSHARLPRLVPVPQGGMLMSWVEPGDRPETSRLRYAVWRDGRWSHPQEVVQGAHWFVNWSDFPSVVPIDREFWVAHWLVMRPGGKPYDYDIGLAYSTDGGHFWRLAGAPHRDGVAAEHGFVAIFPDRGKAGIIWLDGRDYSEPEDHVGHHGKTGRFALRYTTLDRHGRFSSEHIVDGNTCTCCWPAVAHSSLGTIAAWRGRTDDEIRDIRVASLRDGKWSTPHVLGGEGWKIAGCPVNGPALAARGSRVAAAWFTAEGDRPRVRMAFSEDGGVRFASPIEIDHASPLGRIGLAWLGEDEAAVCWMAAARPPANDSMLSLRVVERRGTPGSVIPVAKISAGRDSGVPQLAVVDGQIFLAWTGNAPGFGIHVVRTSLPVSGVLAQP